MLAADRKSRDVACSPNKLRTAGSALLTCCRPPQVPRRPAAAVGALLASGSAHQLQILPSAQMPRGMERATLAICMTTVLQHSCRIAPVKLVGEIWMDIRFVPFDLKNEDVLAISVRCESLTTRRRKVAIYLGPTPQYLGEPTVQGSSRRPKGMHEVEEHRAPSKETFKRVLNCGAVAVFKVCKLKQQAEQFQVST